MPRKHQVDDDAETPAVNAFVIWLLQENFWRNITQGPKWLFAYLTWTKCLAQPKIDQLDLRVELRVHHEYVLWLQISVSYSERVQIEDGRGDLMSNGFSSLLGNLEVLRLEIVEEIATFQVLHYYVNVIRVLKNIVKSDDIRMLAYFQDFYFSF